MSDEQPEQAAWEDRCRDCDNAGVTIQTERRCACQPPFQVEQPKQWARELFRKAVYEYGGESMPGEGEDLATALIQRAFAEREADLVGALRRLYRGYVITLESGRDRITFLGGECDPVERMENGDPFLIEARAALKSREAGHG